MAKLSELSKKQTVINKTDLNGPNCANAKRAATTFRR